MKNLQLLVLLVWSVSLTAQNHLGVNFRIDATKTWKINKKLRLEVGQQFQLNPELSRDQKKYGDIFNEINLFPDDDSDDDGKDDGDDDETDVDNNISQPLGNLNDEPYNILWEWRSATSLESSYKINKWLRVGQSYALTIRPKGEMRHSFQSQLIASEKMGETFQFQQRIGFQYTSRKKKNETIWEEDFVARTGFEWNFKAKHTLESTIGVNGAFDDGKWEWDRLRVDVALNYDITKIQSFEIGYRFQQTLDSKKRVSHMINLGYFLRF
jgi:Protein of unknown function (DUF2490)